MQIKTLNLPTSKTDLTLDKSVFKMLLLLGHLALPVSSIKRFKKSKLKYDRLPINPFARFKQNIFES